MKIIKRYLSKLFEIINKDEMKFLPGHLAYFFILSIVPAITLVAFLCSRFGLNNEEMVQFFLDIIPKAAAGVIRQFFSNTGSGMAIIYLIIGIILVSNGAYAIIIACNSLYKIKDSSALFGRIKSLFLTFVLMFLFIFILVVIAFGNSIVTFILDFEMFEEIRGIIYPLFIYLKWPTAFFIIYVLLKLVYTLSPDKSVRSYTVTKGSIFTTVGWLISTGIYSYYANNIARYDMLYGNLSNIVILMMWIYLISYIFVIGIAINVSSYLNTQEKIEQDNNEHENVQQTTKKAL